MRQVLDFRWTRYRCPAGGEGKEQAEGQESYENVLELHSGLLVCLLL